MTNWLLEQLPAIVVMGVIIFFMYKYILKKDNEIKEKNKVIVEMASEVLKVAVLWDIRSVQNSKEHEKISKGVENLIDMAKEIKYDCTKP